MANSRNYRVPTKDDKADVPYWNDLLAQDVANDVSGIESDVADVAASSPSRKTFEDEEYLAVETDVNYRVSRGVLPDGTQFIPKLRAAHADTYAATSDDYLKVTIDEDGRIAEDAIDGSGRVPQWILDAWASRMGAVSGGSSPAAQSARGIICRGDSITAGAFGDGTSYPTELNKLRPELAIAKRGYPGEQSLAIAQRQGSSPLLVTVTGGTIPASGAVAVTINTTGIWFGVYGSQGAPDGRGETGTINGIRGTLAGSPGAYTFTRSTTGDAYATAGAVPFLSDWESVRRDWNQILMTGYNGAGANTVESTAKMIGYSSGDFLVLSITTSSDDVSGTTGYNSRVAVNMTLADLYKTRYFDLRGWLIANGLAAVGISPTAADNTAIAGDTIPPSLMAADKVHPNANGYKAMAIGINQKITALGWK